MRIGRVELTERAPRQCLVLTSGAERGAVECRRHLLFNNNLLHVRLRRGSPGKEYREGRAEDPIRSLNDASHA